MCLLPQSSERKPNFVFASDQVAFKSSKACFVTQTRASQDNHLCFFHTGLYGQPNLENHGLTVLPFCGLEKSSEERHVYRVIYIHATLSFPAPPLKLLLASSHSFTRSTNQRLRIFLDKPSFTGSSPSTRAILRPSPPFLRDQVRFFS